MGEGLCKKLGPSDILACNSGKCIVSLGTGAFITGNSSIYLYTGIEGQYEIGPIKILPILFTSSLKVTFSDKNP